MLHRFALVVSDVSKELSSSFSRLTRIGEVGTTLAVTSDRRTLRINTKCTRIGELGTTLKNGVFWDVKPCGSYKSHTA
jgi:hypothetical protein